MISPGSARALVLATALLFSVGGAGIKACHLTSWQITSFRSGIAALTLLLLLPEARRRWDWRSGLVGVAYAATVTLFVLSNKLTTSANAIFLQSTAPLYILLLSPWLLRERTGARDILVMAIVGLGMSLLFVGTERPYATAPDPYRGNILAAAAGLCWALTLMGLRWRGRHEGGSAAPAAVIGNIMAFFIGLPWALPVTSGSATDWAVLFGLGSVQVGLAYVLLTEGMRHLPVLEASILLLLEPVLNPVWAWMIHGEKPKAWSLIGGAIILAGTIAKTWFDSRRGGVVRQGAAPKLRT